MKGWGIYEEQETCQALPAPRLSKIYRQKASSRNVMLGVMQAIKLELGSGQKLFDAITTAVDFLEGAIYDSLKNFVVEYRNKSVW